MRNSSVLNLSTGPVPYFDANGRYLAKWLSAILFHFFARLSEGTF